jgi:hypothetical protein
MTVVEGLNVEVLCKVNGTPMPTHTWFKVRNMGVKLWPPDQGTLTEREGSKSLFLS